MITFTFNYKILFHLGNNLKSNASSLEKFQCFLKNLAFIFCMLFFSIIPTIMYMISHQDDVAAFLVAAFQIPAYCGPFLTYICFIFYKNRINAVFVYIEEIVSHRMESCRNGSYEFAIKNCNFYVKFPIYFLLGIFVINNLISMILSALLDIVNGEINTNNWYLPYRFK